MEANRLTLEESHEFFQLVGEFPNVRHLLGDGKVSIMSQGQRQGQKVQGLLLFFSDPPGRTGFSGSARSSPRQTRAVQIYKSHEDND